MITSSTPRLVNYKLPLQPHQTYYTTQYEELGFSQLTQMKDDYTTNSHCLAYTFGSMSFLNFGVKGLNAPFGRKPDRPNLAVFNEPV